MAFLDSPAERKRKFQEQQAGIPAAVPRATTGLPASLDRNRSTVKAPDVGRDPAGALPQMANWALYGDQGNKPAATPYAAPLPSYTAPKPANKPVMLTPPVAGMTAPRPAPAAAVAPLPIVTAPGTSQPASPVHATPAGPAQARGGLTTTSGGSAPRAGDANTFTGSNGITKLVETPGAVTPAAPATRPVPTAAVAPTSYSAARPQVASTFGQPVTAMTEAPVAARPSGVLREPGDMGEQYNKTEDRRAREKQLSDLDSQRFRLELIAGNPGRRGRAALEGLAANAQEQSGLVNEGAKLTADAIANRGRDNTTLANTQLQEQGATDRQQTDLASALGLEGIRQGGENERARLAAKPSAQTQLADGSIGVVDENGVFQPIKDASGNAVKGATTTAAAKAGAVNGDVLKAYSDQANAITSNVSMDEAQKKTAMDELQASALGQRYTQELAGGSSAAGVPSKQDWITKARQTNPGVADSELEKYYNTTYGGQ